MILREKNENFLFLYYTAKSAKLQALPHKKRKKNKFFRNTTLQIRSFGLLYTYQQPNLSEKDVNT
jgi:hypothetical protein